MNIYDDPRLTWQNKNLLTDADKWYYDRLIKHIKYVNSFCEILSVPRYLCEKHDASKFTQYEFTAYAYKFYPGHKTTSKYDKFFERAWLSHIHNNEHHWQHWIIPNNRVLQMPYDYILEMIADWLAMEYELSGNINMVKYLTKNCSNIILHTQTKKDVNDILLKLGQGTYDFRETV